MTDRPEAPELPFLAPKAATRDPERQVWCIDADRRMAALWVGAFVGVVAAFWVATGPVLYGLLAGIAAVTLTRTVIVQKRETETVQWVPIADGWRCGDVDLSWAEVERIEPATVLVLSPLKVPRGEVSALLVDRGGHAVAFPADADLAALERAAETLKARRQR